MLDAFSATSSVHKHAYCNSMFEACIRVRMCERRSPFERTAMHSSASNSVARDTRASSFDYMNLPNSLLSPLMSRNPSFIDGQVEIVALTRGAPPGFAPCESEPDPAHQEAKLISNRPSSTASSSFPGAAERGPPIGSGFGSAGDNRWGTIGMRIEPLPAPVLGGLWSSLGPSSIWAAQARTARLSSPCDIRTPLPPYPLVLALGIHSSMHCWHWALRARVRSEQSRARSRQNALIEGNRPQGGGIAPAAADDGVIHKQSCACSAENAGLG